MELSDVLQKRNSVRKFLPMQVEREKLYACIEAARLAPSACNIQPWKFVIVEEPELKDRLVDEAFSGVHQFNQFARGAGAIVAVVAERDMMTNKLFAALQGTQFYLLDIGIACEHFVLEATELGLGTCWLGWFSERKVKKLLGIPRAKKVAAMLAVGYPAGSDVPEEKKRKSIEEISSFNKY